MRCQPITKRGTPLATLFSNRQEQAILIVSQFQMTDEELARWAREAPAKYKEKGIVVSNAAPLDGVSEVYCLHLETGTTELRLHCIARRTRMMLTYSGENDFAALRIIAAQL